MAGEDVVRSAADTDRYRPPVPDSLRVCHVLHTLSPGGAQDLLRHLATAGPSRGLELSVLALTPAPNEALVSALARAGVPVRLLSARGRRDPRSVAELAAALRAARPHVVHTHGKHADVLAGAVARACGRPVVSTLHLIEEVQGALPRLGVSASAHVRGAVAARTIAVSEAQRRWYVSAFPRLDPRRVVTVTNGVVDVRPVSPAERGAVRASLGAGPDDVLVVALGMMREDRGHVHLVAAARLLGGTGVVVTLVGDGPERARLEAQASGAAGAPVRFPGYRTDVDAVLRAADLVVQPSLADAFPTSLLQALAAGTPVVASAVGGIAEIVVPEVGRLVPAGDPAALADAVRLLAADGAGRRDLAGAARERYEREFTAQGWAERLATVYRQVLAEVRAGR